MATSGTIAQTSIPVIDIIDHSILRCGIAPAKITVEMLDIAKKNMFYYISYLANKGINLWTMDRILIGLLQGQINYALPAGTIDVLNLLYRTMTVWTGNASSSAGGTASNAFDQDILTYCQQTSANGNLSVNFLSSQTVTTVGVMPKGNNNYTLTWEYSIDNTNWTSVYSISSTSMIDGQWYYYDISSPKPGQYFRVRETGGATINFREVVFGWNPTEIPLTRLNRDDYSSLPDKTSQSRLPVNYWYNRLISAPEVNLYKCPSDFTVMLVAWRHRQIQDIGDLTNTIEVPQRWYDCILANTAFKNSLDLPDIDPNRIMMLRELYMAAEEPPYDEERDKAPSYYTPNLRAYTGRSK